MVSKELEMHKVKQWRRQCFPLLHVESTAWHAAVKENEGLFQALEVADGN